MAFYPDSSPGQVTFKGKGMVFSADHMNDPARIRSMCEEGFMSEGRRDALLNFPWHHDIIFHEAGIPPIHTPMQTLQVRYSRFRKNNMPCFYVRQATKARNRIGCC